MHGLIGGVMVAAAVGGMAAMTGCGSNWRVHEARPIMGKPSTANAPDWVQGHIPMAEDRIFFIGRSHTPDIHRAALQDGEWGTSQHRRTPPTRVGYTVMDERDAVQSARNDVYDQVRQRLQPRNVGTVGQVVTSSIDSGTCTDCGTTISLVVTPHQAACNEPCLRSPMTTWPSSASTGKCGPCSPPGSDQATQFVGSCSGCNDAHVFEVGADGQCVACTTCTSSLAASHRVPDYLSVNGQLARDLNVMNIGLESVMPALLAHLQEEEIHFEKWHVHEGNDSWGRPFAEGRDEWVSYKCWILCSIPREDYMLIANGFRDRYEEIYDLSLARSEEDRDRRISYEDQSLRAELKRQDEERSWNREDEIITRDHTITLDKDRHPMPGRRFTAVGSQ
jgi:5-methylcytosine-specific restriction endonuclease McrA